MCFVMLMLIAIELLNVMCYGLLIVCVGLFFFVVCGVNNVAVCCVWLCVGWNTKMVRTMIVFICLHVVWLCCVNLYYVCVFLVMICFVLMLLLLHINHIVVCLCLWYYCCMCTLSVVYDDVMMLYVCVLLLFMCFGV